MKKLFLLCSFVSSLVAGESAPQRKQILYIAIRDGKIKTTSFIGWQGDFNIDDPKNELLDTILKKAQETRINTKIPFLARFENPSVTHVDGSKYTIDLSSEFTVRPEHTYQTY